MGFTKIMADKMLSTEQILTPIDAADALDRIRADAREAALREALTAIAALPLGDGPGIDECHEQAYRTIEALIGGAA